MDMSQAVNVDMAPESLAPGSLLGSLQRTYCQDTRFSQASKLEKGNNIIVCSLEKASRPVIVYLGCPSTPDVFTVHDIRHAPTYLGWESVIACFFRLVVRLGWGELRRKIYVVPARHRIAAHGPQQHHERGASINSRWRHCWPESSLQTIPALKPT